MARDYIRPEISERLYDELAGGRQLLINPRKADLLLALEAVQHSARKRMLSVPTVLRGWRRFQSGERDPLALAAQTRAPVHYQWPLECTLFQAVTLTRSLSGALFERAAIEPGGALDWPIPVEAEAGRERRNAIVTAFWMHLSDEDIQQLDRYTAAA
jgi:hypothetical protein